MCVRVCMRVRASVTRVCARAYCAGMSPQQGLWSGITAELKCSYFTPNDPTASQGFPFAMHCLLQPRVEPLQWHREPYSTDVWARKHFLKIRENQVVQKSACLGGEREGLTKAGAVGAGRSSGTSCGCRVWVLPSHDWRRF